MELMLKDKKITINITSRNINNYLSKGYNVKNGDSCLINTTDLTNNSHQKVSVICEICKSERTMIYAKYVENKNRQGYYGCKKCSNKKRELTSNEKWGVSNYTKTNECKEKIKKTSIERYGVKSSLLNKDIINKIKKTNIEKYGTEYPLSSMIIRDKIKKTTFKNWGVEHYSKTQHFYMITYKNWENQILEKLKKYNITDYKLKIDRTIDIKCDHCNDYYNITSKNLYQRKEVQNTILCTICNKIDDRISGQELVLKEFISTNTNEKVLGNVKNIINKELDIYIPELNLAFEYNGIYWHSDTYKNKNYHLNKTESCENKNIQLIHIWEDDWLYKQDIVKSMILNKLGKSANRIFARKTEVREIIDNKLIRKFLDNNHIQGFVGSKIKLGLFFNNELVSLMTFGKNRRNMGNKINIENHYELLRFCNKLNTNIIGGASKLFKYFIKNYKPIKITTYADRSHSNGNLYKKLNFDFIKKTIPNYSYYDSKMNKYNRFNFRKDILINMGYDKNKTGHQIMDSLNYYRVYNSGNLKFEWKI